MPAKTPKTPKTAPIPPAPLAMADLDTVSIDDLTRLVDWGVLVAGQLGTAFAGLVELSAVDRHHAARLRDGEPEAMLTTLDAADFRPQYFLPLAAQDHGENDAAFETQPARDDLAKRAQVERLVTALATVNLRAGDSLLDLATRARKVTVPAYALAQVAANSDAKFKAKLAPALTFFDKPAAIRRAKAKAKAVKPATP